MNMKMNFNRLNYFYLLGNILLKSWIKLVSAFEWDTLTAFQCFKNKTTTTKIIKHSSFSLPLYNIDSTLLAYFSLWWAFPHLCNLTEDPDTTWSCNGSSTCCGSSTGVTECGGSGDSSPGGRVSGTVVSGGLMSSLWFCCSVSPACSCVSL